MEHRLPDFLIIGVAKAGTTAVYEYLKQHPQIFMSPIKETNYFAYEGKHTKTFLGRKAHNQFPIRTMEKYAALFQGARKEVLIGEASPLYLESPVAAGRIHRVLPKVKLLAILRNPVDRALSAYMMGVRSGGETRGLEEAFVVDAHRVQVGFYYVKLRRFFDLFPRQQIKIVLHDDLRRDTLCVVQDTFDFVGVCSDFKPDVAVHHHVGFMPKRALLSAVLYWMRSNKTAKTIAPSWSKDLLKVIHNWNLGARAELPEDLRKQLIDLYRGDIQKVQDLIGLDLSRWYQI